MNKKGNLKEIAIVFFKLGLFAFGGPAAHIALMDEEIIERRKWMSRAHFLDLIGATNLIPGPNSTEMTMHCGHERGGVVGLFVAGICFIFPAVAITLVLAVLYVKYGTTPAVEPFIVGIKPAVLAIIAGAIYKLGKKAIKGWELAVLGMLTIAISFMGFHEILALLTAAVAGCIYFYLKDGIGSDRLNSSFYSIFLFNTSLTLPGSKILLTFLKVGAILYGSGYVLFAYLDAELVQTGILSRPELIDAIAIGQFTPGPVLSTATFIGYQLGGFSGAALATIGIFLPSFVFVWIMNPLVPKMRQSKILAYFLDCVNVAAVGIMVVVLIRMTIESIVDWRSALIGLVSFIIAFGPRKINPVYIIIGGALLGFVLQMI